MKKLVYAMLTTAMVLGPLACERRGTQPREEVIEERQQEGLVQEDNELEVEEPRLGEPQLGQENEMEDRGEILEE